MRLPLKIPPGLHGDDTTFSAAGRWATGSNVRFRLGLPEVIGGWESLTEDLLSGVCRSVFPWTDNDAVLNIAFGTHASLEVWQGGVLSDITPYGPPSTLGANPLGTTNLSTTVVVTHTDHGYANGIGLKIEGAATTNGIDAANLNGVRTITVINANSYSFTAGAADAASSTGSGGGSAIIVTPQTALTAGAIDGAGSAGFGTGPFGTGPWGTTSSGTEYYAATWSQAAWGQYLLASRRGGAIYEWTGDTAARAARLANAPLNVTYMLVAPINGGYQCFALGCNEEVSGDFNPACIRHSSIRNNTQWSSSASGSTAREYILPGGGRIVAGRMCGPYMLVWTSDSLFLGTFVGALNQPWRFDRVGRNCGLIGPNAAVIVGQTAFWIAPDAQVFSYGLGGQPAPVPCGILSEFRGHLAATQGDKVVASSNATFSEVRFDYPDSRDGHENSRYIALALSGVDAGAWHKGIMSRTAFVDAGPTAYPLATTYAGQIFHHEKGKSADGGSFAWFLESADQLLDVGSRMLVREVWPDFKDQVGPVSVTVTSRETPQGDETSVTSEAMAPGDMKADLLITGRLFKVRFSGESAPTSCRIGAPVFDVVKDGSM